MKKWIVFFFLAPTLAWAGNDLENQLRRAVELSNQGRRDEAASILAALTRTHPSDARVFLSLGLIYYTQGKTDQALSALERSVALQPSGEALYSLALIYESKAEENRPDPAWLLKAVSAWERFLKTNRPGAEQAATAQRHLERLRQDLAR